MTTTGPIRRASRTAAVREAVRRSTVNDEPFVLRVEAALPGLQLTRWLGDRRTQTRADLDRYGAVLFRGFAVPDADAFGAAARAISPELLDYLERAAPRTEVADGVFTSTEFAADQWIPLHHEMSYSHNWPWLVYFYCDVPAACGGATPLASERAVFGRIPAEIRERFQRGGVRYVRNFGAELDLPWQEVFQTADRSVVEAYCRQSGTDFEWTGSDGLRTSAVRQAVARHPRTGERVWFNHAHLFHMSNMPPEVAEALLSDVGEHGLPRNAFYGDGEPIPNEVITLIGDLYRDAAVSFPWHRGDVLVVDNYLAVHGREPFTGDRRILVAMSDLCEIGGPSA
jgi:alpha-ketoglutarate-dependent taurine dioxygenase